MSRRSLLVFCAVVLTAICLFPSRRAARLKAVAEVAAREIPRGPSPVVDQTFDLPESTIGVDENSSTNDSDDQPQSAEDAFHRFADWQTGYKSADGGRKRELIRQGISLAKRRLTAMKELIETNPEAAIAESIAADERQQLPPELQQYLETPVNMRATYTVAISDDPANQIQRVYRQAQFGTESFDVYTYGAMAERGTTTNLPINGIAIGNSLAVAESPVRELTPVEAVEAQAEVGTSDPVCAISGTNSPTSPDSHWVEIGGERIFLCGTEHLNLLNHAWTTDANGKWVKTIKGGEPGNPSVRDSWSQGPKTVLFIRVNFPDDLSEPISESAAYDLMNNVSSWIVANSYGTSSMITTVTPLLTLPNTKSFYSQVGDGQLLIDARAVARQAGYDTSDYQFDAVRFTQVPGFNYSGQAYVRGKGVWLQSSNVGVACHEFGHNYGLWHANYWNASQASIIGPGSHSEYGDIFDTMGSASAGDRHFNANHRNKIDWLGDNYIVTANQSGTYRINAFDIDSLTAGRFYGLKIRKDYDRDYWLELRHLFANNKYIQNGALLHWDPWAKSEGGAHLLDTTPGSPAASSSKDDAALLVGRTFVDDGAGVFITPVALNGTGTDKSMDVVVNMGNFPDNHSPQISLQVSADQVAPSEQVTLTAAATDEDGDALAYDWDFGDLNFGANQPAMTYAWPNEGEYVVRCRVSDMKGGFASAQTVIRVGNPTTYRISGRILDATGNPIEGVRVSNGTTSTSTYRGAFTDSDGQFVITRLSNANYTLAPTLYGFTFTPTGGWSNPVSVSADVAGADFVATPMTVVGWEVVDGTLSEAGSDTATIRLSRTGSTNNALIVKYNRSGTATYTSDYTLAPIPGATAPYSITIPAGQNFVDVTVTPKQDTLSEGPESVMLTLAEDTAYKIGWQAEARVDIEDDETPGKPSIYLTSSADNQATETGNDTMAFTVNRFGNKTDAVTVHFTFGGTATPNDDYVIPEQAVTIPAGETSATVTFAAIDDNLVEGDETVVVTLVADAAYNISGGTTTLTIQDDDPPTVKVSVTDNLAVEGGSATGKIVVQRVGDLSNPLTVDYVVGGTATSGFDFKELPGSVTIPAGEASASITVTALNDTELEGDESVAITLVSRPDYNIGLPGVGIVVIQDNELPTVTLAATDSVATEGASDPGTFTFTRTDSSGDLEVHFNVSGNAISSVDYDALPPSILIPDGSTTATLSVVAIADGIKESDEAVTLKLLPSTNYNVGTAGPETVSLQDDGSNTTIAVGFADASLVVPESQSSVKIPVVLSAASSSAVTVDYAVTGGSAQSGGDFVFTAGTLTFPANQTLATISLSVINDNLPETDETIVVELSNPSGAGLDFQSSEMITIADDDAAVISITAPDDAASESGDPGIFRLDRTGDLTKPIEVQLQFTGSASFPSDYEPIATTMTIPAGADHLDIPVVPVDDTTDEADETVVARITTVSLGKIGTSDSAIVTIHDNDDPSALPVVEISVVDDTTTEGIVDPAQIQFSRTGNALGDLTVHYTVSGTATPGLDYDTLSGSIVIPDGATNVVLDLQAIDDAEREPLETVTLALSEDATYQLGPQAEATVQLLDSPFILPIVEINVTDDTTTEGVADPAQFRFSRTENTSGDLTIYYSVSGSATPGLDYDTLSGSIVIPDNQTEVFLDLQAIADTEHEPLETLTLTLVEDQTYQLGSQTKATVQLLDSPFMRWEIANSSPDNPLDPAADPDGDGMNNFTEYAMNKDPNLADASPLFTQQLEPIDNTSDQLLVVTYQRRIERPDVEYVLGVSDDLVLWDESPAELQEASVTPDENGITETVRTEVLAPLSHFDHKFVRLRIIRP